MNLKYSFTLLALTLCTYTQSANSATILAGPYELDTTATVSSIQSGTASNLYTSTGDGSAITDQELTTYLYGNPDSSTAGSVGLNFSRNIFNGADSDLVFYFIWGQGDQLNSSNQASATFDLNINGITLGYEATLYTYTDPNISDPQKYQYAIGSGFYDLLTATVNLDDFNIENNGSISGFNIAGISQYERLALAGGFYTNASAPAPVPVPAAIWLFVTGLTALGLFSRRKV